MDVFAKFATDEKLEIEGAWHKLDKDASLLVARANNEEYLSYMREQLQKNQADLDAGGKSADELAEKIMVEAMALHILKDWKGLKFKGADAPYSVEMARTFLRIKDFRKQVQAFADKFSAYQVKAEEAQGNA